MSHIITTQTVNQFLPKEKLEIPTADPQALHTHYNGQELENTVWDIVTSKLHEYDLSTWVNSGGVPVPGNIPSLIKNIMGMWVAGRIYQKQFSEESLVGQGMTYGERLVVDATEMLEALASGLIKDAEVLYLDTGARNDPTFLETDPVFTMGQVF